MKFPTLPPFDDEGFSVWDEKDLDQMAPACREHLAMLLGRGDQISFNQIIWLVNAGLPYLEQHQAEFVDWLVLMHLGILAKASARVRSAGLTPTALPKGRPLLGPG